MKKKTAKDLFLFLNKKKVNYVVLRGYDSLSKKAGKDLDILILKKDYNKIKKTVPKINREVDFYQGSEKHFGVTFVPGSAVKRRVWNEKLGFFVLSTGDKRRMRFFRTVLKGGRVVKGRLGMYDK